MNVVRVDGLDRPCIEGNTIYVPQDTTRPDDYSGNRWHVISNIPIAIVVRIVWADSSKCSDIGWIDKWVFFDDKWRITWEQVPDKVAVARKAKESLRWSHGSHVVPWGDDIETLIALESS